MTTTSPLGPTNTPKGIDPRLNAATKMAPAISKEVTRPKIERNLFSFNDDMSTIILVENCFCVSFLVMNADLSDVFQGYKIRGADFLQHALIFSRHAKCFEANLMNFLKTLDIKSCKIK